MVSAGYSWFAYKDSRLVGYEDQAKTDKDRKTRSKLIEGGKIAPEDFDKAFAETPKAFYVTGGKGPRWLSRRRLQTLESFCDEKFEDDAPSFGKLKTALTEVRHTIHLLLDKKREKEPDPVEEAPVAEAARDGQATEEEENVAPLPACSPGHALCGGACGPSPGSCQHRRGGGVPAQTGASQPRAISHSARSALGRTADRVASGRHSLLEAPPTELRQKVKRLALAQKWSELLDAGEHAMALPCSRAWLDLQRLSVAACSALGSRVSADRYRHPVGTSRAAE